MNPSITNRGLAKVRFFAIYILSVLLIVLLLSSFLMPKKTTGMVSVEPVPDKKARLTEILHQRMEPLQQASIVYFENGMTTEGLKKAEAELSLFLQLVDSLRKNHSSEDSDEETAAVDELLNLFAQRAQQQITVLKLNQGAAVRTATPASAGSDLQSLKAALAQRDKKIAELEARALSGPEGVANPDDGGWKEKYTKLKSANEKTAAQLDAVKDSYKEVVEDNRRLIAQLQAARAGKN